MKRRDFFTRLVKTTAVVAVMPAVLKDSELKAKELNEHSPDDYGDNEVKKLDYTGDFKQVACSGGLTSSQADWLFHHNIDKAMFT